MSVRDCRRGAHAEDREDRRRGWRDAPLLATRSNVPRILPRGWYLATPPGGSAATPAAAYQRGDRACSHPPGSQVCAWSRCHCRDIGLLVLLCPPRPFLAVRTPLPALDSKANPCPRFENPPHSTRIENTPHSTRIEKNPHSTRIETPPHSTRKQCFDSTILKASMQQGCPRSPNPKISKSEPPNPNLCVQVCIRSCANDEY